MLGNSSGSEHIDADAVQDATLAVCAFFGAVVSAIAGFGGAVIYLAFGGLAMSLFQGGLQMRRVIMMGILRSAWTNPITLWLGRRDCDSRLGRLLVLMTPGLIVGGASATSSRPRCR